MKSVPSGNIAFLFTDIEGSTKLSQENPELLPQILEEHHAILTETFEKYHGFIFENLGDAFYCAFQNAGDAVKASVDAQLKLSKVKHNEKGIKVRMGIHSGPAAWNGKKYSGYITLARTARVMSVAYGEQILISKDAYELAKASASRFISNEISFRDLGERKLKDLIQPLKLFQIVSPGIREEFPLLKTLDVRPNNLPTQLTSFVGRESEMTNIKQLLRHTRLLTLTGSGGTGKTRLALQVTADMIDEFENGVWYIELDNLHEPKLLPNVIMQILGVNEQPRQNADVTLSDYLKDRELLMILDNCEHIINASSKLAEELLKKCPQLKILATSREPLKCHGEQTLRIKPMTIPDLSAKKTYDELSANESVELFVERASSINPLFKMTEQNAEAIATICCRLDGIPLAIELAAARTNIFPVEKILERLDDRFKFLTGGKRTALKRQQTLGALINWSYELLDDKEKLLWKRLSVFSGGWTIESAENICSDKLIQADSIVDILSELTEKSIIIFNEEKLRFRMLETIRKYGEEKLKDENEFEKISSAHLNYFKQLSVSADIELKGKDVQQWLKILDSENRNIEKALKYSISNSMIMDGVTVAGSLGFYWRIRGYMTEAVSWYKLLLQKCSNKKTPGYCLMLSQFGYFLRIKGNLTKAKNSLEESLKLSRKIGYVRGVTESLNALGLIEFEKGKYAEAEKLFSENLSICRKINDKSGIAYTLNNLGTLVLDLGETDRACALYSESLDILREIGDTIGISRALNNLVVFEIERGKFSRAKELLSENLKFNREIGNKRSIANTLTNSGGVAFYQEDYESATNCYNESLEILRELGDKYHISYTLINLGNVKIEQNKIEEAKKMFEESLLIADQIEAKLQTALAYYGLGRAAFVEKNNELAKKYYRDSLSLHFAMGSKADAGIVLLRILELEVNKLNNTRNAKLLGFLKNYIDRNRIKISMDEENTLNEMLEKISKGVRDFENYFELGKALNENQIMKLL